MNQGTAKAIPVQTPHIAYLDIAKGIGILLVIFAHINIKGPVYQTIYAFHMPLFFILAGMTFKSDCSFGEFISKKAKRLILPYIAYSVITFAWYALVEDKMPEFTALKNQTVFGSFMEIFLARGSVDFLQHNPALWFIPCLFVTEIIYFGLCKCSKRVKLWGGLLLGICGCIFTYDFMPEIFRVLPWQSGVALCAIPFLLFGEFIVKKFSFDGIRNIVLNKKALSIILTILSLAAVFALMRLNNVFIFEEADKAHVSMGTKHIGNIILFYANAILGSLMILSVSILLEDLFSERISLHKSWLCWLGENSYAMMAIHYPVKRRMMVIVAQAINSWNIYPVKDLGVGYTTFTGEHLLPSLVAFLFTLGITVIIAISAKAFIENAHWVGRRRR